MASGEDGPALQLRAKALSRLAEVLLPSSLVAALIFYFGWMRTRVLFQDLGLSAELMNYSNTDYALRSIDVIVHPLRVLLVVVLLTAGAHVVFTRVVMGAGTTPSRRRLAVIALIGSGTAGLLVFDRIYGLGRPLGIDAFTAAAGWMTSMTLVAYGAWWLSKTGRNRPASEDERMLRLVTRVVMGSLLVIGLFVLTAQYARVVGHREADRIVAAAAQRPDIVLYSATDLGLRGSGVGTDRLVPGDSGSTTLYRIAGLKYLAESDGRLLVYPASVSPQDRIIVIDSGALTRFEFVDSGEEER